jgi:hypothetical protein
VEVPWLGICCENCWTAKEEICVCHCGGRFHGMGAKHRVDSEDAFMPDRSVDKYLRQVDSFMCHFCGASMTGQPVRGYDHDAGWTVEGFPEKQWLYIVCPKCQHQWGFNHLGVTREGNTKDGASKKGHLSIPMLRWILRTKMPELRMLVKVL